MIDGQNIGYMARGMFRKTDLSPTDWNYFVWPEITSHSKTDALSNGSLQVSVVVEFLVVRWIIVKRRLLAT